MSRTLLITTALAPGDGVPHLSLGGGAQRTLASKAAALFWAAVRGIERIVIADATGTALLGPDDLALIEENGVRIEQVSYRQDDSVAGSRGKGAAEGALIEYALGASQLLREEPGFFKVTGKLLCRNFTAIQALVENQGLTRLFWQDCRGLPEPAGVDLRFFLCGRDFFTDHLARGYAQANDRESNIAEGSCMPVVAAGCTAGRAPRPLLTGLAGGSAAPYAEVSLGDLDRSFPCWYAAD